MQKAAGATDEAFTDTITYFFRFSKIEGFWYIQRSPGVSRKAAFFVYRSDPC